MLDMGFLPDVERIVAMMPAERQTMLFSATMPGQIVALARRYMTQPTHIRAADAGDESATVDAIEQHVWRAHPMDKNEIIARVLQAEGRGLTMIFMPHQAPRPADRRRPRRARVRRRRRSTATSARAPASRRCARSATARSTCSSPPTSRPAASTSTASPTSSTTSAPTTRRPTSTASAAPAAPASPGVAVTLVDWEDLRRWEMIDRALELPFDEPLETYSTVRAHLHRPQHPRRHQGPPAQGRRARARASTPRSSRTSARPASPRRWPRGRDRDARGGRAERSGGQGVTGTTAGTRTRGRQSTVAAVGATGGAARDNRAAPRSSVGATPEPLRPRSRGAPRATAGTSARRQQSHPRQRRRRGRVVPDSRLGGCGRPGASPQQRSDRSTHVRCLQVGHRIQTRTPVPGTTAGTLGNASRSAWVQDTTERDSHRVQISATAPNVGGSGASREQRPLALTVGHPDLTVDQVDAPVRPRRSGDGRGRTTAC